ncbi:multidrug effflux MFS transporter [Acuticoccus sediminis]|uniref:multidrug effflux MFS transporter n=1 Tax=Acuticoccus sediminis TaxID=2184697 RepID=UPI001CFC784E|nr:multidrug effflux MFS transporter [Acuticoccus sediminis]
MTPPECPSAEFEPAQRYAPSTEPDAPDAPRTPATPAKPNTISAPTAPAAAAQTTDPTPTRSPAPLWLLISVSTVQPIALNMYVPAMGTMQSDLSTTRALISATLSAFLVATALATLVVGALSDLRGRRPVLIGGLALFAVGSAMCAAAPTITVLIVGRIVQAIGSSVGLALSRAVVRDIYGARSSASAIAYVTMGMAVAPMLAPSLGGVMSQALGWRSIFLFMAIVGVATTVATVARLGETHPPAPGRGGFQRMKDEARELFGIRAFWHFVAALAFICTSFFAFIAGSAFVAETILGLPPAVYGLYFMCVAAGYIVGNFCTGRFVERLGLVMMIRTGTVVTLAGIVLAALAPVAGIIHPLAFFGPMTLVGLGNGFALPNAIAGAVSVRPHLAGTASGLAGSFQLGAGAVASLVVGLLCDFNPWPDTMWPVMGPMLIGGMIALFFSFTLRRGMVS